MWNLDWFKARRFACTGVPVRRASWDTKWFLYAYSLWWVVENDAYRVVKADDYSPAEFKAGDWTTLPSSLQCGSLSPGQYTLPPAPAWAGNETFGSNFSSPPPGPFFLL